MESDRNNVLVESSFSGKNCGSAGDSPAVVTVYPDQVGRAADSNSTFSFSLCF